MTKTPSPYDPQEVAKALKRKKAHGEEVTMLDMILKVRELEAELFTAKQRLADLRCSYDNALIDIQAIQKRLAEAEQSQGMAWAQEVQHRNWAEHWKTQFEELEKRLAEAEAKRDEFERKGKELCCSYGNSLVEIHELKKQMKLLHVFVCKRLGINHEVDAAVVVEQIEKLDAIRK